MSLKIIANSLLVVFLLINLSIVLSLDSDDIPRKTSKPTRLGSRCGLPNKPDMILKDCTEPLKEGVPDMRGNWTDTNGHSQVIEQCGDRFIVWNKAPVPEGSYVIHDFLHADGTIENGCHDYKPFAFPHCIPIRVAGTFEDNCYVMKAGNFTGATRCLNNNGTLTFFNAQVGTRLMNRVD